MMMNYGVRSIGPSVPVGLLGWVVAPAAADNAVRLRVFNDAGGNDGRSRLALGVMRSIVDGAASGLHTKYEDAVDTIHENIEKTTFRARVIEEVRVGMESVGDAGSNFLLGHWAQVLRALDADHPLNPRLSDADHAVSELGGMQLYLTSGFSRKRRRVGVDDVADAVGGGRVEEEDVSVSLHVHSDGALRRQFLDAVVLTAGCVAQPDTSYAVFRVAGMLLIEVSAADVGMAIDGDASRFFSDPFTGRLFALMADNVWYNVENGVLLRDAAAAFDDGAPPERQVDTHPSVCMHRLVMPALRAAALQQTVYMSSVNRVEDMLSHVHGFSMGDAHAQAFTDAVLTHLTTPAAEVGAVSRVDGLEFVRLSALPSEMVMGRAAELEYDFILDFDTVEGWVLGLSPSPVSDAAEACQVVLSSLLRGAADGAAV
jgi:hypothetical protein